MLEHESRQNMTDMEWILYNYIYIKRARGKCIANTLVSQLCWIFCSDTYQYQKLKHLMQIAINLSVMEVIYLVTTFFCNATYCPPAWAHFTVSWTNKSALKHSKYARCISQSLKTISSVTFSLSLIPSHNVRRTLKSSRILHQGNRCYDQQSEL